MHTDHVNTGGLAKRLEARLFAAVCVREITRPADVRELHFTRDYAQTERMFERLAGRVPLAGRSVLDFGCGRGPTCTYAALSGARRVVGVDVNRDHVEFARQKLRRDYPKLQERVEFVLTQGGLTELDGERFDVVISQNSFEHYPEPEAVVADVIEALHPGGMFMVAFAPTWKAPGGGHLPITSLPWAHLLFSEEVVMAQRRRLLPHEQYWTYEDCGINQMTLEKFRRIMDGAALECRFFATNLGKRPVMKLARLASRVPGVREYFTQNVYSIWIRR